MTEDSRPRRGELYRLAWVLYLLLAVGGAVWVGARGGTIPLGLFLNVAGWWMDLAWGLAAAAALLGVWEVARRALPAARRLESRLAEMLGPLDRAETIALALLSGFAEELFFRGAMQGAWGWFPALVIFTLLHTGPGGEYRLWTLFAAVAGGTLAALMAWRGNLLAPVVAHGVVNAVNLGRLGRVTPGDA